MRRLLSGAALALVCITGVAHADDSAARAEADSLFQDGRAALDKGDIAGACALFARSSRRLPQIGPLLNLGTCYERLGRLASAWGAYREALTIATARHDDRTEFARGEAARLEPRLPKLTITVDPKGLPISVTRNGDAVDASVLNHATPVDPGVQRIRVTAPDHEPWEGSVTVAEAGQETIVVPALAAKPAPSTSWLPLGLEIGGGALVVGGLVFGGLSFSRWSDVEGRCPNGTCPNETQRVAAGSDSDSARTFATISTIGVITGLVVVAAGVVLHVLDTRVTSTATRSIRRW